LRRRDKPSYKSKTDSTRKVGRPPKQVFKASNDVTSQTSTSQSKNGKKRKASICSTHFSSKEGQERESFNMNLPCIPSFNMSFWPSEEGVVLFVVDL